MSIVSEPSLYFYSVLQKTMMTAAQVDEFFNSSPDPKERELHGEIIIQWLKQHPTKSERPVEREDILDELIELLAEMDSRYSRVKSSLKKCKRKRYKSLYDSYDYHRDQFDKEMADKHKAGNKRPSPDMKKRLRMEAI